MSAILVFVLAYVFLTGILIYGFAYSNKLIEKTVAIIPFPAAILNFSKIVSVNELNDDLKSIENFYANQDFSKTGMRVDFSTPEGEKRLALKRKNLLEKNIENRVVEILAREKGLRISDSEINQQIDRKISEYSGDGQVLSDINRLYGWDENGFREKIVKPDLYREALEKYFRNSDKEVSKARMKINQALKELKKDNFEEIARKYSEGESAKNNGEVGWFSFDQMLPEVARVIFKFEKGETSGVIESPIGFHVVKIEDKKTEDGVEKLRIRQIFVRTGDFSRWLLEKEKEFKIYIPLKEFYWDNGSAEVKFRDAKMQDFAENFNNFEN